MKLASFSYGNHVGWGAIENGYAIDLSSGEHPTLQDFVLSGRCVSDLKRQIASASSSISVENINWLPPITQPTKILCVGVNYASHAAETQRSATTAFPSFFVRFVDSQVGHLAPLTYPATSEAYDFEGELAMVIGRRASKINEQDAAQYVFGLSCFGDHSARDWQKHGTQATAGKNFRHSGAFGPWIETDVRLKELGTLLLTTRVNGRQMQQDKLGSMIFSPAALLAYVSQFTDLSAGDVIVTGTPSGVGMSRNPPEFLQEGDSVEIEIERIGVLRNTVASDKNQ